MEPPTRYENRNSYPVMLMFFDQLRDGLVKRGGAVDPWPLLATLPLGNVNAVTKTEPETRVPVIFFDQGLFQFLYDFSLLLGWAAPALSPVQLSDDVALSGLSRSYTMPPGSSEFFAGALNAYAIEGTPIANPSPLTPPRHNMFLSMILLGQMELFVMAHELAHIKMGHWQEQPSVQHEYEADEAALALVGELAIESSGSWAVGFWACDLALTVFHFLYRAVALLKFGPRKLVWISKTHPDPLSRRARLRDRASAISPNVPQVGRAAAGELCGMSDALLQRLWEFGSVVLLSSYQGGARSSPLWNDLVQYDFAARD